MAQIDIETTVKRKGGGEKGGGGMLMSNCFLCRSSVVPERKGSRGKRNLVLAGDSEKRLAGRILKCWRGHQEGTEISLAF